MHEATYQEQIDACAADGARVCTQAELNTGCTQGTGCGIDAQMIWTNNTCTVARAGCTDECADALLPLVSACSTTPPGTLAAALGLAVHDLAAQSDLCAASAQTQADGGGH